MKIKGICVFCALLFIPMLAFSQAVTLDNALRNATTYLNGRIKANTKVVVLNFTSDWPRLSDYIIDELIGYVVNDGTFTVVDRNNLETIRKELNFQLSGEVSDETAQSIGKMLGAQTIINGNITAIGNAYRLRVRAISVESAQIIGMNNVDVAQDSRVAALTGTASVGPATTTAMPITVTGPNVFISPTAGWETNHDKKSSSTYSVGREQIDGKEYDVLSINTNLTAADGDKWTGVLTYNMDVIRYLTGANGVRFKAAGDGKKWIVYFVTKGITDEAHHRAIISTQKGKVSNIDISFRNLKQPDWKKRSVAFNKNDIEGLKIERNGEVESGAATIKIFDFEVY